MEAIAQFLIDLAANNPKLVSLFAIGYVVGIAVKVLREAAAKIVAETPDSSDNLKLEKLEKNVFIKGLYFLSDLLIRLKIEKK